MMELLLLCFMGKSLKDEESKWRKSAQIRIDQDEDMENDITSGCYVLDIGIPDMSISRLWIREIL